MKAEIRHEREDQYLVQYACGHRNASTPDLGAYFQFKFQHVKSFSTLRKGLHRTTLRTIRA